MRPRIPKSRLVLALVAATSPVALPAQQFGRWWWDAAASYQGRQLDNQLGAADAQSYQEQTLRLRLGIHGYLGHPALGWFRLFGDFQGTETEGIRPLESDRVGYGADFELMPRGKYPLFLSFARSGFDYGELSDPEIATRASFPETMELFRARWRARAGWLRGLYVAYSSGSYDYLDATETDRVTGTKATWSRDLGPTHNVLHFSRDERDYSVIGLETDIQNATYSQTADLGTWRSSLTALTSRYRSSGQGSSPIGADESSVQGELERSVRDRDLLSISAQASRSSSEGGGSSSGYLVGLYYRWRPRAGLQVAPFARWGWFDNADRSIRVPGGGVQVSLHGRHGSLDGGINASASYTASLAGDIAPGGNQNSVGYSLGLTGGTGNPERLRAGAEVTLSRNDLRLGRPAELASSEELVGPFAAGADDSLRARILLERRRNRGWISGWVDWADRSAESLTGDAGFDSSGVSLNLDSGFRRFSARAGATVSRVSFFSAQDQRLRSLSGAATWQAHRFLELSAGYRTDEREMLEAGELGSERVEIALTSRVGAFQIRIAAYDARDETARANEMVERRSRGITWSVRRDFAGWLPIVTGTKRRGTIR